MTRKPCPDGIKQEISYAHVVVVSQLLNKLKSKLIKLD